MAVNTGFTKEQVQDEYLSPKFNTPIAASGHFKQRKYFKILKNPILSRGEVHLDKELGLVWQTNVPVFSRLLLKKSGLYSDDGKNPIKEIKGGDTLANVIMRAMLGEISTLREQFAIKNSNVKNCVELTPKNQPLANVIRLIKLCGKIVPEQETFLTYDLEHIVLFERTGNRTEIDLEITPQNTLSETVRAQLN